MKTLIFDSGPLISIIESGLFSVLPKLKEKFAGQFLIPRGVKKEIVDKPITIKRFKFEALRVLSLIEQKVFEVIDDPAVTKKARQLEKLGNSILWAYNHPIKIMQLGELEVLAAALLYNVDTIVVDERVTRTLIENPQGLKKLMERRLHTKLRVDNKALKEFEKLFRNITIVRSVELLAVAFDLNLLDNYVVNVPHARRELLDSVLWGAKLHGCSVTDREIETIIRHMK